MPGDPNHSASVGARPSWLPHPVLLEAQPGPLQQTQGYAYAFLVRCLGPLSNSVGLLIALEALPDTGTAPSHRSRALWRMVLGLGWVTLSRHSSTFLQQLRPFHTYFASKTSSHLIQLFRGMIPPPQNLYVLYRLPVHKDSIVYTTFCLFRNSLYVRFDFRYNDQLHDR
jgi:hypothetical protein